MAIERTLSKTQKRVFAALSQQKQELMQAFQEVNEAEQEQIEMLRERYDLPKGEYRIRQDGNGDVILFAVPEADGREDEEEADSGASS